MFWFLQHLYVFLSQLADCAAIGAVSFLVGKLLQILPGKSMLT